MRRIVPSIAVAVIGAVLVAVAVSGAADRSGAGLVEAGFKRALVAFALARALNGVISVVQGTGVAFEPAGVGISLAPGEILDPVNDLVERFSWVMLASTTSFGIQRLLLDIFAWPGVSIALAALVLVLVVALWRNRGWLARRRGWLLRLALFVAVVRFLVPALAYVGEAIHHTFIEPRYTAAMANLEEAAGELGDLSKDSPQPANPRADASIVERLQRLGASLDVDARLEKYKELGNAAVESAVNLIVIFVFQTLLLPLLFLWVVRLGYRTLIRAWRESLRE